MSRASLQCSSLSLLWAFTCCLAFAELRVAAPSCSNETCSDSDMSILLQSRIVKEHSEAKHKMEEMQDSGISDAGMSDARKSGAGMSDSGMSDAGMSDAGMSNAAHGSVETAAEKNKEQTQKVQGSSEQYLSDLKAELTNFTKGVLAEAARTLQPDAAVSSGSTAPAESKTTDDALGVGSAKLEELALLPIIFVFIGLAGAISYCCERTSKDFSKDVAEFFGTFVLVFSVGCNVLVGDANVGVVAIACTLMVCIYALGGVSGANFNPAVSMALGLIGKMAWPEVGVYVCSQLAGGLSAGLAYSLMLGNSFPVAMAAKHTWLECGIAELLYTFVLVFVVLNTAASKAHEGKNEFYGLAISFSIIAGHGAGALSGGCFNPAVSLGIDATAVFFGRSSGLCFVWIIFEILGALVAVGLFRIVRPGDFHKEKTAIANLASECIGTYILVLTVGLNILSGSSGAVFSIASSLTCMIFALGSVSGAHFNPAVTAAIFCSDRNLISKWEAVSYIFAQVTGGLLGALTASLLFGGSRIHLEPVTNLPRALSGEFLFTLLLCFVVLSVATVKTSLAEYFGLAIGACVIAGGLAVGSLSGGSLNPAVTAGLSIKSGKAFANLGYYACVQILAGFLAAAFFKVTHVREYNDKIPEVGQ